MLLVALVLFPAVLTPVPTRYRQLYTGSWAAPVSSLENTQDASFAYTFLFPLVSMNLTAQDAALATATSIPFWNHFDHEKLPPTSEFTGVVNPNVDTLYSSAWLDLSSEPIVMSLPATAGVPYFVMQILDFWTNTIASPGSRTLGSNAPASNYLIAHADFTGNVPAGMTPIYCNTKYAWLLGRTEIEGGDLDAVDDFQKKLELRSLTAWLAGEPANVAIHDLNDQISGPSVLQQILDMDASTFFNMAAALMTDNPPADADAPAMERLAAVGIVPGKPVRVLFNPKLLVGKWLGDYLITGLASAIATDTDGWRGLGDAVGNYGTDYATRAVVAKYGLGANVPEDAVYYTSPAGSLPWQPTDYDGSKAYTISFKHTPPVHAFWSLTIYVGGFLVESPLGGSAHIGTDSSNLAPAADGSITIYLQPDEPAHGPTNWIPTPRRQGYTITARYYEPGQKIINGSWTTPPLVD